MAANSNSSRGIASFGKRLVNHVITRRRDPTHSSSTFRRGAQTSAYDKNVDEEVRPAVVPDNVIEPESDKYWAPHPQTGVFGPATEQEQGGASSTSTDNPNGSVLEEKAWFRPTSLEDSEKPLHT